MERLPRKLGQVICKIQKDDNVVMRSDIEKDRVGRQFLRALAVCFPWLLIPWPGLPP